MNGTVDDYYYEWLYSQVGSLRNKNPDSSYWSLCKDLYTKPFTWSVPNDDNRVEDGKVLREEFLRVSYPFNLNDQSWMELPCSIFEMLIALGRRAAFNSYGEPSDWFWHFITNLGLINFVDRNYNDRSKREVLAACRRLTYRTYRANGDGGLFPLVHPEHDQRKVEIWYQLSAYILEGEYIQNGPRV